MFVSCKSKIFFAEEKSMQVGAVSTFFLYRPASRPLANKRREKYCQEDARESSF